MKVSFIHSLIFTKDIFAVLCEVKQNRIPAPREQREKSSRGECHRQQNLLGIICACSVVSDSVILQNIAHQAPLFMGFFKASILE